MANSVETNEQQDNQPPDISEALRVRQTLEQDTLKALSEEAKVVKDAVIGSLRIDILMRLLGYQVADCHMSMLIHQESAEKTLTLAPRGIGKSTSMTVVRTIFELLLNPNIRILIVSNTQTQAETFLREVKQHFERNEKFIEVFGDMIGTKWDTKEIDIKMRTTFAKESNVTCLGVGGAIIGRHYDLIIGDDLVETCK
jgi:hypothetical protein